MNVDLYKIRNLPNLVRGLPGALAARLVPSVMLESRLYAILTHADGRVEDLGLISTRVVTTAGVNYISAAFINSTTSPLDVFKYHGSGTGVGAEAVGDTALGTEVETRATGTQVQGTTANIYKSVATVTYTGTRAITEHGLFSASTSGTLLDRSVFAAINVVNLDSVTYTYNLTISAGG